MMGGAYSHNGQRIDSQKFYSVACDPQQHVVVEACAGAGKTWLLVSRIVRAMLEGVAPSSILAITFTRKAAAEMRERLHQCLFEFAQATEQTRIDALCARGLSLEKARQFAPALANLYPLSLCTDEKPRISTIHGWFSGLVHGLPLDVLVSLGLPAQWQMLEDIDTHWEKIWSTLLQALDDQREEAAYGLFVHEILQGVGLHNLQNWLREALKQRVEIKLAQQGGTLLDSVPSAAQVYGSLSHLSDPLQMLDQVDVRQGFEEMRRDLCHGKTASKNLADLVMQAFITNDVALRFEYLKKAFLTSKDELRALKGISHTRLGWAQDLIVLLLNAQAQNKAHRQHRAMIWVTHLLFDVYARFKKMHGIIDMADLELAAARLHQDPVLSGWVQERMDLRIKHLLIDEFQDTSPLQWQILHNWISGYAYGDANQGLRLFIVGDPKQSIYGFRRADPRVFEAASRFVCDVMGGVRLACDHTWRNAKNVVQTVNSVMSHMAGQGGFPSFRAHTTASGSTGQVRVLPDNKLIARARQDEKGIDVSGQRKRDSLVMPKHVVEETSSWQEAVQCAQVIAWMVQHEEKQLGDFFVLARKRSDLAQVADALQQIGLAHVFPETTRLMETCEAQDLLAVLEAIIMPSHNLALARALRSPAFDASDQVLMALARHVCTFVDPDEANPQASHARGSWWTALMEISLEAMHETDKQCIISARRLFSAWQNLAQKLPPHDLLQRVVDDSGWRYTLAKRLSPPMLRQSLLYLDAVVSESLLLGGGRDATPARWLKLMRKLKTKLPSEAMKGVVQLLTIHGAKGLEADVVFLVNCDPNPPKASSYNLLVDWPDDSKCPSICAFMGRSAEAAPSLSPLLKRLQQAQYLEECNALYVALTRSREQLILSRTESSSKSRSGPSWWQHLWASQALSEEMRWTLPDQNIPNSENMAEMVEPNSDQITAHLAVLPTLLSHEPLPPLRARDACVANDKQAWCGTLVHQVLDWATQRPVVDRSQAMIEKFVNVACERHPPDLEVLSGESLTSVLKNLVEQVCNILNHPTSSVWLDPEKCYWSGNEVTLWYEGEMLRIDRLVCQQQPNGSLRWWVIDYKMHESPHKVSAYVEQLKQYQRALAQQEPNSQVCAAFINRHGKWLELDVL